MVLNAIKFKPPVTDTNPNTDPDKQNGLAGANPSPGRAPLLQDSSRVHVLACRVAVKCGEARAG